MIELAQEINEYMPAYVAQRAISKLGSAGISPTDARVLVLGVAYKPDVGDVRETSATPLVRSLRSAGITTTFADPYVSEFIVDRIPVPQMADAVEAAANHDLVIVHTPHRAFDMSAVCAAAKLVLDTRGVTAPGEAEQL
jgi:UDP-N-acetyl-D-mannosaminuronate dehydrogenase